MLYVPACTYERRPYSATVYPTSFTLDSCRALIICAQRKTDGLRLTPGLIACGGFLCHCMFWDERGGGLTRQPVDLFGDTSTIITMMSTNRMDSGRFRSPCLAFRRTHTSADPIRLLCIRLALPLPLSLPSQFSPSARRLVGVSLCALWLSGVSSCDCMLQFVA